MYVYIYIYISILYKSYININYINMCVSCLPLFSKTSSPAPSGELGPTEATKSMLAKA